MVLEPVRRWQSSGDTLIVKSERVGLGLLCHEVRRTTGGHGEWPASPQAGEAVWKEPALWWKEAAVTSPDHVRSLLLDMLCALTCNWFA